MPRQLYYFNVKALGEGIRYVLHYGGIEFEDIRIPFPDWPNMKDKIAPFGKLPVYKDGNITLLQSSVIAKHIGKEIGLVPSDPLKETYGDMAAQIVLDFFYSLRPYFFEKDEVKKAELKRIILEETVPLYFSKFEKKMGENNGYLTGELTWADLYFVGVIEVFFDMIATTETLDYPNIKALINKVHNLKGIKEYVATRSKLV